MKREAKSVPKTARNVIISLDILIALLIIFTASKLSQTAFGRASLIFGFVMIFVITTLRVFQKV